LGFVVKNPGDHLLPLPLVLCRSIHNYRF